MKKSKKILVTLLAGLMIGAGAMGFSACLDFLPGAQGAGTEGLAYEKIEGKDEYRVVGIGTASDLDITIPQTYNGLPVTEIAGHAFRIEEGEKSCVTSVVIPDSVTSIGDAAFHSCTTLTSVEMGDGVTSIGAAAFYGCTSLTNMELGDGVTFVGNSAFLGCTSLTYTTEGDLKYLGNSTNAYLYLAGTSSMDIRMATINKNCKIIGESAFYDCEDLRSVEIPDGVVSIGKKAFCGCNWLYSIEFPDSLISIGDVAFNGCYDLTSLEIPDSVTFIGEAAFWSCTDLTSVTIGKGLTSIGNSVFWNCTSLKSVVIPNNVTSIVHGMFKDCTSLTAIEIPDSVTSIGESAFSNCISLTSVVLPDRVTSIGYSAFSRCYDLTSVVIGDGVTLIDEFAFFGCRSLASVYYKGTASDWINISIDDSSNSYLTNATQYYYSETEPTAEGNYWHYDENGEIEIWVHVHSYDQEVAESDYLKEKATCASKAVYYKSCTCGLVSDTETFEYGNELENILILERNETESDLLKDVLDDNEKHQITVLNIFDTPCTLDELIVYDQIILVNVSNSDMPEGLDEVLNSYVYDMGGNLFTVGGNDENGEANTYDRQDMYGTLYQEMLPVQAINYTPPVGVVFIVDTSGSMAATDAASGSTNIDWAKASIQAGLDALTERDYVGIVTLDSVGEEVLPMTSIVDRTSILTKINSIGVGEGGTVFSPAIEKAGQMLRSFKGVAISHIIMITDGVPSDSIDEYGAFIKNNYESYGITFSIIGIGVPSTSLEILQKSVELGNGRVYAATGANLISFMREELSAPEIKDVNYETFSLELLPEYAESYGISPENFLTLDGFYGTKLKNGATAILTGAYNVPIYAQWSYGKGIVGSFMCDLNGEWSKNLLENSDGRRLINNLICRGINP